jgi:sialic acid synthase SpsE
VSLEIAGRRIDEGAPLFVIAELGLNHGGHVDVALALVDAAADAGASAVKLQTFSAETLVAAACPAPAHVAESSLRDCFRRFELDAEAHRVIRDRAHARGLAFMATPFSHAAVDVLEAVDVDAYKIASGDLTYGDLLARVARTGRPIVISTGMSSLTEVETALRIVHDAGARQVAFLHCVSAYPVPPGSENLRAIETLRQSLRVPVGLSDHGADASAVPLAVALGASLYERHLMLPGDDGVDAAVSSAPTELAEIVRTAARVQAALGHGRKECLPAEAVNLVASRRSLHTTRRMRAGSLVDRTDITALRPATGLSPDSLGDLIGCTLDRDVEAGEPFLPSDLRVQGGVRDVA